MFLPNSQSSSQSNYFIDLTQQQDAIAEIKDYLPHTENPPAQLITTIGPISPAKLADIYVLTWLNSYLFIYAPIGVYTQIESHLVNRLGLASTKVILLRHEPVSHVDHALSYLRSFSVARGTRNTRQLAMAKATNPASSIGRTNVPPQAVQASQSASMITGWYVDTAGYYPYLLFSTSTPLPPEKLHGYVNALSDRIPGIEVTKTMGPSSNSASNGQNYDYYVRLNSPPSAATISILTSFLGGKKVPLQNGEVETLKSRLTKAKEIFRSQNYEIIKLKESLQQTQHQARLASLQSTKTTTELNSELQNLREQLSDVTRRQKLDAQTLKSLNAKILKKNQEIKVLVDNFVKSQATQNKLGVDSTVLKEIQSSHDEKLNELEAQLELKEQESKVLQHKISGQKQQQHSLLNKLDSQSEKLGELVEYQALFHESEKDNKKLQKQLDEAIELSFSNETHSPQSESSSSSILKQLESFMGKRIQFIDERLKLLISHEIDDSIRSKVMRYICYIKDNELNKISKLDSVEGCKHWQEGYLGKHLRIYFRRSPNNTYSVLVGFKKEQTNDMKILRRNDS